MPNPDVTGDFAAFNNLTLAGIPVTPGGPSTELCMMQSLAFNVSDDTPLLVNNLTVVDLTDPTRFIPQSNGIQLVNSGIYLVIATVNFNAGDSSGIRRIDLMNSAIIRIQSMTGQQLPLGDTPTPTPLQVSWLSYFVGGNVLGIQLFQNSGNIMPTNGIFLQIASF
jgi:hypothetical protein